jgi:hypothetical protein
MSLTLQPGVLEGFTHNQEPFLRKLGLVTRLKVQNAGCGVPELLIPFTVCTKGKRLTAHQATLLVGLLQDLDIALSSGLAATSGR